MSRYGSTGTEAYYRSSVIIKSNVYTIKMVY